MSESYAREATVFKYIAHLYQDGYYYESIPLTHESFEKAEEFFRARGFLSSWVWTDDQEIVIDSVEEFMRGDGVMSNEEWTYYWGMDIVTWVYGEGPYPPFIYELMGETYPLEDSDITWHEYREEPLKFWRALVRSIEKNELVFQKIFWTVSGEVVKSLRPGRRKTVVDWVYEVFKHGSRYGRYQ